MILHIDTSEAVKYTAKLERMHRSALPVAVRTTLNSAAFDVKKTTMPNAAADAFINREKNFFKANSRVEQAAGFNIMSMRSTVGFISRGGTNYAVEDLEQQEYGGSIGGRALIGLQTSRTSGSWEKRVKRPNRVSALQNVVDAKNNNADSSKEQYTRSALHAGVGGYIIGNIENPNGNKMLMRIRKIIREGKNTTIVSDPLYAVQKGRKVDVKATHFMQRASMQSGAKLEKFYIQAAQKQIAKLTK